MLEVKTTVVPIKDPSRPKPKKVTWTVISHEDYPEIYEMLDYLVKVHHSHLKDANIQLMWNHSWRPNKDGRCVWGKCTIVPEQWARVCVLDIVIGLNYEVWQSLGELPTAEKVRKAILDHELCHADVVLDEADEHHEDALGRKLYRSRHHDIEEFDAVVARHGAYRGAVMSFLQKSRRAQMDLFEEDEIAREFEGATRGGDEEGAWPN